MYSILKKRRSYLDKSAGASNPGDDVSGTPKNAANANPHSPGHIDPTNPKNAAGRNTHSPGQNDPTNPGNVKGAGGSASSDTSPSYTRGGDFSEGGKSASGYTAKEHETLADYHTGLAEKHGRSSPSDSEGDGGDAGDASGFKAGGDFSEGEGGGGAHSDLLAQHHERLAHHHRGMAESMYGEQDTGYKSGGDFSEGSAAEEAGESKSQELGEDNPYNPSDSGTVKKAFGHTEGDKKQFKHSAPKEGSAEEERGESPAQEAAEDDTGESKSEQTKERAKGLGPDRESGGGLRNGTEGGDALSTSKKKNFNRFGKRSFR